MVLCIESIIYPFRKHVILLAIVERSFRLFRAYEIHPLLAMSRVESKDSSSSGSEYSSSDSGSSGSGSDSGSDYSSDSSDDTDSEVLYSRTFLESWKYINLAACLCFI